MTAKVASRGVSQAQDWLREHPYAAVAAACGLGYVVGGGLLTPLSARVALFGLQRLAIPLALERLLAVQQPAQPSVR